MSGPFLTHPKFPEGTVVRVHVAPYGDSGFVGPGVYLHHITCAMHRNGGWYYRTQLIEFDSKGELLRMIGKNFVSHQDLIVGPEVTQSEVNPMTVEQFQCLWKTWEDKD